MQDKIIMFPRGQTYVAAKIIKTVIEPLETGNGHQVVFFCQDVSGRRYRVPKSQVKKGAFENDNKPVTTSSKEKRKAGKRN